MEMPRANAQVLARKPAIVEALMQILPVDAVVHDEAEVRAYECDALTA